MYECVYLVTVSITEKLYIYKLGVDKFGHTNDLGQLIYATLEVGIITAIHEELCAPNRK